MRAVTATMALPKMARFIRETRRERKRTLSERVSTWVAIRGNDLCLCFGVSA